jgi:hypothetical protein
LSLCYAQGFGVSIRRGKRALRGSQTTLILAPNF